MKTFDEFVNESYSPLNEKRLNSFHPFLDGSDIWPEDIKQFFVNGSTAYILFKGTDEDSDRKSADIILTKIKTMFGRLRQRTYRDRQPDGGYHVEVTYTKKDKIPEKYHVKHVEEFDPNSYTPITENLNEGKNVKATVLGAMGDFQFFPDPKLGKVIILILGYNGGNQTEYPVKVKPSDTKEKLEKRFYHGREMTIPNPMNESLSLDESKVADAIMDAIDDWYDAKDQMRKDKAFKELFKYIDMNKGKVSKILNDESDAYEAMVKIMELAESIDEASTSSFPPPKYLVSPALDPEGNGIPVDKMHKYMEDQLENRSSYFKPGIRSANPPENGREVEHTLDGVNESKGAEELIQHIEDEMSWNNGQAHIVQDKKDQGFMFASGPKKSNSIIIQYAGMKGQSIKKDLKDAITKFGMKPLQIEMENGDNEHYYNIEVAV